jgi:hypothetical protein
MSRNSTAAPIEIPDFTGLRPVSRPSSFRRWAVLSNSLSNSSASVHDATEGFPSLAALPVRHMGIDVGSRTAIGMPNPVINDVELEHAHPADLSTISSDNLSNKCRYDSHQLSVTYCVAQENSHG